MSALVAAGCAVAGAQLALHHPLWPGAMVGALASWILLAAWRPELWLLVVPACLPWLDFSPWTGWIAFSEFDLLVLGALAGGHARLALQPRRNALEATIDLPRAVSIAAGLFVVASVQALWRGVSDAGGPSFGWFQSYVDPINSVRLFKPLLFALLALPLLRLQIATAPGRAMRLVAAGMTAGLAVATLAVLWERMAYPGWLDFSKHYRAVGLFWEMHVGGAAIDAYLVMAVPFLAWILWSARTPLRWIAGAALALLAGYACLTTFSRGVYLAVAAPLALLGLLHWRGWQPGSRVGAWVRRVLAGGAVAIALAGVILLAFAWRGPWVASGVGALAILGLARAASREPTDDAWRRAASSGLGAALIVEVLFVMSTGSFLVERVGQSNHDLRSRIAHWTKAVGLLHGGKDWALGIGLGRLPAHFARSVPGYEFPGAVALIDTTSVPPSVRIAGAPTLRRIEGLYALTQRVPLLQGVDYRAAFDVRMQRNVSVFVAVCSMHLLYEDSCQSAVAEVEPGAAEWQRVSIALEGPPLRSRGWLAPRSAVFELSVLGTGRAADFANIDLRAGESGELLRNGDFAHQLAYWFPSAQSHFLPWHADNLVVELLVERGLLGLASFVALLGWILARLVSAPGRGTALAPSLAAALSGVLLIGLVSSVMDAPRAAFLLFFLMSFSALLCGARSSEDEVAADPPPSLRPRSSSGP